MNGWFAGRIPGTEAPLAFHVESGRIDIVEEEPEGQTLATGLITPLMTNAHTHMGDAFLAGHELPTNVAELVGPKGIKHRMLQQVRPETQAEATQAWLDGADASGVGSLWDFREGGLAGVAFARSLEFDGDLRIFGRVHGQDPLASVLQAADGYGASGLRDVPQDDLEDWRDACRKAGKPFAIHVSEDKRDDIEAALALEPDLIIHLCKATKDDLRAVADERIPVAVCPRSNAHFGLRSPIAGLIEEEATWLVGTDNAMLADANPLNEWLAAKRMHKGLAWEDFVAACTVSGTSVSFARQSWAPKVGQPLQHLVLPEVPL